MSVAAANAVIGDNKDAPTAKHIPATRPDGETREFMEPSRVLIRPLMTPLFRRFIAKFNVKFATLKAAAAEPETPAAMPGAIAASDDA